MNAVCGPDPCAARSRSARQECSAGAAPGSSRAGSRRDNPEARRWPRRSAAGPSGGPRRPPASRSSPRPPWASPRSPRRMGGAPSCIRCEHGKGRLLPSLRIEAPRDVPRGREARIRIAAPGRQRVAVYMRATGSAWSGAWYTTTGGAVRLATVPVAAEVAVVATDGRSVSDTTLIRASDRPFVGGVALRAVYPSYLHRAEEALPPGETARVPRGTRIDIAGRASTELGAVMLVRGADTTHMQPDGRQFSGHLMAETPGQWSWFAAAAAGPIADLPDPLQVDVIPDSAPRVEILSPGRDTIVTPGDRIPLSITASDDHALASVVLRTWRTSAAGTVMPECVSGHHGQLGTAMERRRDARSRVAGAAAGRRTADRGAGHRCLTVAPVHGEPRPRAAHSVAVRRASDRSRDSRLRARDGNRDHHGGARSPAAHRGSRASARRAHWIRIRRIERLLAAGPRCRTNPPSGPRPSRRNSAICRRGSINCSTRRSRWSGSSSRRGPSTAGWRHGCMRRSSCSVTR